MEEASQFLETQSRVVRGNTTINFCCTPWDHLNAAGEGRKVIQILSEIGIDQSFQKVKIAF
jgi:hypothetical protein